MEEVLLLLLLLDLLGLLPPPSPLLLLLPLFFFRETLEFSKSFACIRALEVDDFDFKDFDVDDFDFDFDLRARVRVRGSLTVLLLEVTRLVSAFDFTCGADEYVDCASACSTVWIPRPQRPLSQHLLPWAMMAHCCCCCCARVRAYPCDVDVDVDVSVDVDSAVRGRVSPSPIPAEILGFVSVGRTCCFVGIIARYNARFLLYERIVFDTPFAYKNRFRPVRPAEILAVNICSYFCCVQYNGGVFL